MKISISNSLKKLADIFPTSLYAVGGYIRNQIMGIETDDVDICSSLNLEELETLLKDSEYIVKLKSKTLGAALITCGDEKYEYTTFRGESYDEGGQHSPTKVWFIDDVREDAKRRDFTCNAIYYDIKNEKILDFYNGVEDIKKRLLKTVETPEYVLSHDGLRIMRLFRFACELNFKIDKETLLCARKYKYNLRDISGERVENEIRRILHSGEKYKGVSRPNAYMKALREFNKANIWPIFGIDRPKLKYRMVKKAEHKSQGLLIDIIDNVNPISISYYLNLILTNSFGISKKMTETYINIICGYYEALNRQQNKPYFFRYFEYYPYISLLLAKKSKYLANKYDFFYKYIISNKIIISVKDLKINGDDIKKHYPEVNPKRFKPILESLLSDIFDGRVANEKEELIEAVKDKLKYL